MCKRWLYLAYGQVSNFILFCIHPSTIPLWRILCDRNRPVEMNSHILHTHGNGLSAPKCNATSTSYTQRSSSIYFYRMSTVQWSIGVVQVLCKEKIPYLDFVFVANSAYLSCSWIWTIIHLVSNGFFCWHFSEELQMLSDCFIALHGCRL